MRYRQTIKAAKAASAGILALCIGLGVAPLRAQTPPAAGAEPKAVLSQTIRGVTVSLSDVHWQSFEPTQAEYAWSTPFFVQYNVKSYQPLPLPPGKSLLDYVTSIRLTAPDGTLIKRTGNARTTGIQGELIKASASWDNVDPRWPLIGVDIDFLDPNASVRAAGQESVPVTFKDLPTPAMGETVRPVQAEVVTPLGTHITIERVTLLSDPELVTRYSWRNPTLLNFVFHAVTDPRVPDMRFSFLSGITVVDSTGKTLSGSRGSESGGHISGEESVQGFNSAGLSDTPAPGAKTMTLTLPTTESSESLTQESALRHFHLLVPLNSSMFPPRLERSPKLVQTGKSVSGTVDTLTRYENFYYVRLILRDRTNPKTQWRLRHLTGSDDAGSLLASRPMPYDDFYWKTDAAPLVPGETARSKRLGLAVSAGSEAGIFPPPPAKTLTLNADVEAFREQAHVLDFARVPVPTDGTRLSLNRSVKDAFGGRLVLRSVLAFSPTRPLPPGFVRPHNTEKVSAGMVVVLAEPPSITGDPVMDYHLIGATDAAGKRLRPTESLNTTDGNGLIGKSPAPAGDTARTATLFLRPAAPGAKTFNLRMGRTEPIDLHKSETLVFPAIPAPPKPSAP